MSSQPKLLPMLVAAALAAAVGSARAQDVKVCTFAGGPTHAVDTAVTRAVFSKLGLSWKEVDASDERMQKKIRNAQKQKVPYMLIAGDDDVASGAVSFRFRDGTQKNGVPIAEAIAEIVDAVARRVQV